MTDFLPTNYQVPSSSDNYMKFDAGENRFRILASPVIGSEWWIDTENGRKPERRRVGEPVPVSYAESVKHFWAMPVWNYKTKKIQILEITQKSIQKFIKSLSADDDWGTPLNYDLVVSRSGEGLLTEYQVSPKPAKEITQDIAEKFLETKINLDALFEGKDPFQTVVEVTE